MSLNKALNKHAREWTNRICLQDPDLGRSGLGHALSAFWQWRGDTRMDLPSADEMDSFLQAQLAQRPVGSAHSLFAYLQIGAARIWGGEETRHFSSVLRRERVSSKPPRMNEWERARGEIVKLPDDWQEPMLAQLERSERGTLVRRDTTPLWSASYCGAVARALAGWHRFCTARGLDRQPSAVSMESYAQHLVEGPQRTQKKTAHDYLARVYAAFRTVLDPGFSSSACEFVLHDWEARSHDEAMRTKSAKQLVTATAIRDLGWDLIEKGRGRQLQGMHAARDVRNGILLITAVALPQRARALSALEFDKTLILGEDGQISISIPGKFIKQREARKARSPYKVAFVNYELHAALDDYRKTYLPMFGHSRSLAPSMLSQTQGIGEKQIGRLVGDLTFRAFGVRISVHRIRDNVATEIAENLSNGGLLAGAVLGHRSGQTTARHYDHSTGVAAVRDFAEVIDGRRSRPIELMF